MAIGSSVRHRMLVTLAAAMVLAGLGGCGGGAASVGASPGVAVVELPALQPGTPVPVPVGEPVLTLTGRIASTNVDGTLRLDRDTLDRLGRIQVTVLDPWTKQDLQVQGTWLADLLTLAQADPAAQSLHLTALDDYQIDLSLVEVRAGGIMLATRTRDGAGIGVDEGGPTRIVFVGASPAGSRPELWIWSLDSIDIR